MTPIDSLDDFFPAKYRTEINSILDELENQNIRTVEQLAAYESESLGILIHDRVVPKNDLFLRDMYATTVDDGKPGSAESAVEIVLTTYIIGDIDDPTTRLEQERVNNVWNYFLGLFGRQRQEVMKVISSNFRDNVRFSDPSNPFKQFAEITENDFISSLTDPFYSKYAEYLIDAANRYLRVNRRDYQVFGKVIDSVTSKPIKNAKVTAMATSGLSLSGITYSNFNGFFSISFTSLTSISSVKNIEIKLEKNGVSLDTTIAFDPADSYKISTVSLTLASSSSSEAISSIITEYFSTTMPADLSNFFSTYNIEVLEDIRSIGLLRNHTTLTEDLPDNEILQKFDSLALLELVNSDFKKNNDFIVAGYNSFVDIASTPRAKFIEDHSSILGSDYETLKYYEASKQIAMTAVNEIRQPKDKFYSPPTPPPGPDPYADLVNFDECGCSDCESAVGPMAYLADLLSFADRQIETPIGAFDTQWMEDNLYRNFTDIPIDCSELENTLCQSRIATEVLQGMLASGVIVPSPQAESGFNERVIEYLVESYDSILTKLGTSYDELRNYQTVTDIVERERYAHRLGIVLVDIINTGETVSNMYKDKTAFTENDITFLQDYFGIESTLAGEVPFTAKPYLESWKEERLIEVWAERDRKTTGYEPGQRVIIDPDIVTVDDFRFFDDPFTTGTNHLVDYDIWKARRTFIDSQVYNIFAELDPWSIQGMADRLEGLNGFTYTKEDETSVNINSIWGANSLVEISSLVTAISSGSIDSKITLWDDYNLKADEAARLIELEKIEQNISEELSREEKIESFNICTQVVKRAFKTTWINEEVANSVELSSKKFWISEREPLVGDWQIEVPITDPPTPLIDPQIISLNGLPEITFRTVTGVDNPKMLYEARVDDLNNIKIYLSGQDPNEPAGYIDTIAKKVDYAFEGSTYEFDNNDTPPPEPKTFVFLNDQLNNPSEAAIATNIIENVLKLTIENFVFIMDLAAKFGDNPVDLSQPESERLSSILVTSRKIFNEFQTWTTQENGKEYWILRKAQLPKWRASVAERNEWTKAYQQHNEAPIIDADLIGPAYLVNPVNGDRAFDLWLVRYNEMHNMADGWYKEISQGNSFNAPAGRTFENYKDLLDKYLMGNSGVSFYNSLNEREKTEDITPILEQLLLSSSQFRFLMDVGKKLEAASFELSEDELNRIYYTLALVQKKKAFYRYTREEAGYTYNLPTDVAITQSPEYFVSRDTDYYSYPPVVPYPLNHYLVSEQQLSAWRKIVSSRTDEEDKLRLDYTAMLLEVDDDTMGFLRDALVEVLDESNQSTSEKARKLGDRLLIDLQDNCCSKTNRVAMAIETVQQVIWKTHTGDIYSEYDLNLIVTSFDTVWEWMGSYANWRASMFVFLYPENILLPSLKRESTPGFLNIIRETQNNRNFNPGMACEIAKDYREYLADVSSLGLKTSAQTSVVTQKENHCAGEAQIVENLTFVFATAENSGKSYYMTVKTTEDNFSQKTFWNNIPNIHDKAIIKGSDIYHNEDRGIHFVYVFYLVDAFDMRDKIYAIRYDVNKNEWESDPMEFQIEKDDFTMRTSESNSSFTDSDSFTFEVRTKILALAVCENSKTWESPYLSISLNVFFISVETGQSFGREYTLTFSRQLSWDGISFNDSSEWYNKWVSYYKVIFYDNLNWSVITIVDGQEGLVNKMVFIQNTVGVGDPLWYGYEFNFLLDTDYQPIVQRISRSEDLHFVLRKTYFNGESIFAASDTGPLYGILNAHPGWSDPGIQPYYREIYSDGTLGQLYSFFLNTTFKFSSFNGQYLNGDLERPLIYQINDGRIYQTTVKHNAISDLLEFSESQFPLTPKMNEIPAFDSSLRRPELELLRAQSESNLLANTDDRNPKLRIYAEEAYYFAPTSIARKLSDNGYYADALKWFRLVYDYFANEDERKIYYGLILEENYENLQDRVAEWYEDPLNPHAIAATRQNAYTRFTIMSIGSTLLSYANAEFTKDNSESNPRARELYEDILDLISVLDTTEPCAVDEKIRSLESYLDNSINANNDIKWKYKWQETFESIRTLRVSPSELDTLVTSIEDKLDDPVAEEVKFANVQIVIADQIKNPKNLIERVESLDHDIVSRIGVSMAGGKLEPIFKSGQKAASSNTNSNLKAVTGFSIEDLPTTNLNWLYNDSEASQSRDLERNPVANSKSRTIFGFSKKEPKEGYNITNPFPEIRISGMSYLFCVAPNPIVKGILLTAYMNLHKIHNCMNIAGMVRELSPFAAPTDATSGIPTIGAGGVLQLPGQSSVAPTNYRYGFLVERAKQMVSIAQQMESSMLQSLEKFDAESYAQLRAEQDLELAKAGIKLQDLRVKEAQSNKTLAELQKERANIQVTGLQDMISQGLLSSEIALVAGYSILGALQATAELLSNTRRTTEYSLTAAAAGGGATAVASAAASATIAIGTSAASLAQTLVAISAIGVQTSISISSVFASLQRRQQEWNYQKTIASQDVKIGTQQIKIADDRIRIAGQERAIAGIQQDQAEAVLDFLKTKFTNAELYEWMSGVLEDVYSYFLQEATAMSKLAEQQLAFERQIDLPKLIKNDYWNLATTTALTIGASTSENDRKGLTGSARLLKDLSQLEQYAIDTNQRKLQITKVLSLNEHDPVQMEMFRDSGIIRFTTTLRDFDWDYPGHYLRLIRRVSVTVIALTPPNKGIKATLINNGISAVVTNSNNIFQKRFVTRSPERIALSSPYNEYGMFQLDTNDAMYRPFEGSGVETLWELQMEKASNPFDYRSIADVLVTIEYDALENDLYSKTIKNQLNNEQKNESIVLSMRNDLPDQWYELMNPSEDSSSTNFKIRNSDLAPNVLSNSLTAVKAYLSFDLDKLIKGDIIAQDNDGKINITSSIEGDLVISKIEEDGAENGEEGGARRPLNNFLISNLQNFESFPNIEDPIQGNWQVRLTQTTQVLNMINEKQLRDIILIFEYSATKVEFSLNA